MAPGDKEKGGRVVFIGNIPYGFSEEQICELFATTGTVVNFRLVYDKETGRPKGFGFLEYTDPDSAASAVRNLNNHDVMGRTLRVDWSNDNGGGRSNQQDGDGGSGREPPPAHFHMNNTQGPNGAAQPPFAPGLPPLPQGAELPPGITAPDAISKTLQQLQPPQLLDVLSQMKNLVTTDPGKATALLQQAPQLSYAIFQALLLLGLVDTSILAQIVQTTQQQQVQQPPAPVPQVQPPQPQYIPPPQQYQQLPPPQSYGNFPPHHQVPLPQQYGTPVQQLQYQPPPPQQQQPPPQQQQQPDQQTVLIQQVLAMTPEMIYALDESPRNQLIALRAQLGRPV